MAIRRAPVDFLDYSCRQLNFNGPSVNAPGPTQSGIKKRRAFDSWRRSRPGTVDETGQIFVGMWFDTLHYRYSFHGLPGLSRAAGPGLSRLTCLVDVHAWRGSQRHYRFGIALNCIQVHPESITDNPGHWAVDLLRELHQARARPAEPSKTAVHFVVSQSSTVQPSFLFISLASNSVTTSLFVSPCRFAVCSMNSAISTSTRT